MNILQFSLIVITLHGQTIQLPDPLTLNNGKPVESAEIWYRERRSEILELFRQHVYGRAPVGRPADLSFTIEEEAPAMEGKALLTRMNISFSGPGGSGSLNLLLFTPRNITEPVPCFLLINNRKSMDPTRAETREFWPAEEIVARGYAAAVFQTTDVALDKPNSHETGVFSVFDAQGERAPDAWGTIAAWAWGASRVMDALETLPHIDAKRVALVGHSRGGKTALWAGAQDERFAMVISNDSGTTGAALTRGKVGEQVQDINERFPYWFCANYKAFNGRADALPVDQHQLLALIAPRFLYIASASEDEWADPEAEFMAGVAATPVYQLSNHQGLSGSLPPVESPLHEEQIGHHIRAGKHDLTLYDWQRFMDFADQRLKRVEQPSLENTVERPRR